MTNLNGYGVVVRVSTQHQVFQVRKRREGGSYQRSKVQSKGTVILDQIGELANLWWNAVVLEVGLTIEELSDVGHLSKPRVAFITAIVDRVSEQIDTGDRILHQGRLRREGTRDTVGSL